MYLEHYGLRELPFSLTPDTSFFFGYGHYRDAFNTLMVALQQGEGFIKVTGEVGTGKTLLCRKLLNSLGDAQGEQFTTAYIPNPYLTPSALILAIADELGLTLDAKEGTHRALKRITERLIALGGEGKKVVLCIDEAQAMPEQTLETLRLITNLETEKRKLLHVVLFGQPELDERLAEKSARQLRQRITFSYTLQPIDAEGLGAYLQHRLLVAGGNGEVGFDSAAVKQLYRGSGGIPRLINILAHKALMLGYGQGVKQIGAEQVKAAIADTEGAHKGTAAPTPKGGKATALAASFAAAALLLGGYYLLPLITASEATPLSARTDEVPAPAVQTTTAAPPAAVPASETITATPAAPVETPRAVSAPPAQPAEVAPENAPQPRPAESATEETVVASATPTLTGITPSRLSGGWEPQQLLLHGTALPHDPQLLASWAGREKLLPAERVEWLNSNTLRVTLTTGVRSDSWRLQLVQPDGQRSDAVTFEVVGTDQ